MSAFPQSVSLTITNRCNLACRMCGQWSEQEYMRSGRSRDGEAPGGKGRDELGLADWKRVVDELADHHVGNLLLRGGEAFLFPGILPLLEHIRSKGIHPSIDTNGTQLAYFAEDIVRIGGMHLTVSVDGPEQIHDSVRGTPGAFARIREGLRRLGEAEHRSGRAISKAIAFTISPYSYQGLGRMPDVARSLGVPVICIVAYYYFPRAVGERYEQELRSRFQCAAFSWRGFHHEQSGVDADEFLKQLRAYRSGLNGIVDYPYFPMAEEEYRTWFADAVTPVGPTACANVEQLIDIQPAGEADFCVDFPDYTFGNVRESTIEEIWNSPRAEAFREYRRKQPLAVCARCGAKYMAEIRGAF